jgi:CubicO group peptidase (beta-lactamase class C family)
LQSTAITLSPELKAKLAAGHDASLQPSPAFSAMPIYSLMPAAGGLVSTAKDMSTFLAVAMGYEPSPLAPAMAAMLSTRRPMSRPGVEQALGWTVEGEGGDPLIFHDGGTWGYASAVAWDPKKRVGVVVLSNQVGDVGDVARHLLRSDVPLAKPTVTKHTEIFLDSAVLGAYAGQYEAPGEGIFVIARENDFLTIQAPSDWGLPKLRLRPESQHDFFASELPLRVTFQTDDHGRVTAMLIYPPRGQKAVPANRIYEEH